MKKNLELQTTVNSKIINVGLVPSFLLSSRPDPQDLNLYIRAYKERKRLDGLPTTRKNP